MKTASGAGLRKFCTLFYIIGATSVLKLAKRGAKLPDWLAGLMARKPFNLVAVALANKIARVIWALLVKGGVYKKPALASTAAA